MVFQKLNNFENRSPASSELFWSPVIHPFVHLFVPFLRFNHIQNRWANFNQTKGQIKCRTLLKEEMVTTFNQPANLMIALLKFVYA